MFLNIRTENAPCERGIHVHCAQDLRSHSNTPLPAYSPPRRSNTSDTCSILTPRSSSHRPLEFPWLVVDLKIARCYAFLPCHAAFGTQMQRYGLFSCTRISRSNYEVCPKLPVRMWRGEFRTAKSCFVRLLARSCLPALSRCRFITKMAPPNVKTGGMQGA